MTDHMDASDRTELRRLVDLLVTRGVPRGLLWSVVENAYLRGRVAGMTRIAENLQAKVAS